MMVYIPLDALGIILIIISNFPQLSCNYIDQDNAGGQKQNRDQTFHLLTPLFFGYFPPMPFVIVYVVPNSLSFSFSASMYSVVTPSSALHTAS